MVVLQQKVAGLTKAGLERFLAQARRAAGLTGHVNVLVTSNTQIRSLNRQFRRKDRPTDVLSFPALPTGPFDNGTHPGGDIAISADIAAENATRFGHSVGEEIKILILHGILHLAGFDHESDNGSMARKEAQLRQSLNLPSGLIERVHSGKPYTTKKKRKRRGAGAATV